MAFKTLVALNAETTISLGGYNKKAKKENPTSIEGYYLGSKQVDDAKTKGKVNNIYYFQTPKGNVAVWGKTDMDKKMSGATLGACTRITHTGFKPTKNGEMYVYSVEVDTDNTIEVEAQAPTQSSRFSQDEELPYENDGEQELADYEAEEASQTAALAQAESAASRKANVEALLNKGKTARK